MASPRPVPGSNVPPLIPDDIQWEIMSQTNTGTTTVGPNTRILHWNSGVVNANVDDLEAGYHIDTGRHRDFRSDTIVDRLRRAHTACTYDRAGV